jgi:hypothetical protein
MSRYIPLTTEALAVLRSHSQGEFVDTSVPSKKPGHRNVSIDSDTIFHLESLMYPGETYSECIIRLFSRGARQ